MRGRVGARQKAPSSVHSKEGGEGKQGSVAGMERQLGIDRVRAGQSRLNTMGDAANKESASELQVPEQSAEGWQEAGKSSPSCCCSMAEGRGRSLGLLFHSLTKKEIISVTAEA